jgi:mannose-6-phosphate isomerase-like protein (cupin superfamily)
MESQPIVVHRTNATRESFHEGEVGRDVLVLLETQNMVTGITLVHPHSRTKGHIHPRREEHYYVLSGTGYILLDGQQYDIRAGDGINVPAVSLHTVVNPNDEPLEFFWAAFPDEPKLDFVHSIVHCEAAESPISP